MTIEGGLVAETAPVVSYTRGWTYDRLVEYMKSRGAMVEIIREGRRYDP